MPSLTIQQSGHSTLCCKSLTPPLKILFLNAMMHRSSFSSAKPNCKSANLNYRRNPTSATPSPIHPFTTCCSSPKASLQRPDLIRWRGEEYEKAPTGLHQLEISTETLL